tara:strand:- start:5034 stop:5150 length:117 start_codon:yes stop_codon:yes gene_type:complete
MQYYENKNVEERIGLKLVATPLEYQIQYGAEEGDYPIP